MPNYHPDTHNSHNIEIREKVIAEVEQTAEESFRQGWYEAITDNTIPVSQLWDGIDAE